MMDAPDTAHRFQAVAAGHVVDALTRLGLAATVLPPELHRFGATRHVAGPARTLRLARSRTGEETRGVGELVDDSAPGDVLVIDAQADPELALIGDRAALAAEQGGVAGIVVNGAV